MTDWRDVTAKNAKEGRVNKWRKENGQPLRKEKHWMTSQGREGEKVAHQNYNPYWNRKTAPSRMGRASAGSPPRALSISLSRIPGPHFFLTVPGYLPLHERTLQQLQSLGS